MNLRGSRTEPDICWPVASLHGGLEEEVCRSHAGTTQD